MKPSKRRYMPPLCLLVTAAQARVDKHFPVKTSTSFRVFGGFPRLINRVYHQEFLQSMHLRQCKQSVTHVYKKPWQPQESLPRPLVELQAFNITVTYL